MVNSGSHHLVRFCRNLSGYNPEYWSIHLLGFVLNSNWLTIWYVSLTFRNVQLPEVLLQLSAKFRNVQLQAVLLQLSAATVNSIFAMSQWFIFWKLQYYNVHYVQQCIKSCIIPANTEGSNVMSQQFIVSLSEGWSSRGKMLWFVMGTKSLLSSFAWWKSSQFGVICCFVMEDETSSFPEIDNQWFFLRMIYFMTRCYM